MEEDHAEDLPDRTADHGRFHVRVKPANLRYQAIREGPEHPQVVRICGSVPEGQDKVGSGDSGKPQGASQEKGKNAGEPFPPPERSVRQQIE
jgi:hypothetical protein